MNLALGVSPPEPADAKVRRPRTPGAPTDPTMSPEEKTNLPVVSTSTGDLTLYVRDMKRHPVLSRGDEEQLAKRWYDDRDPAAFQQLILANLRFVVKVANEYRRYGFRIQDLVQEGNVGLIKAVIKFNPYRGYRLISYAVWWIRAQIHDYILKNWSMVKLGTTQLQRKLFYKLQGAQSALKERLADDAGDSERERLAVEAIADALGTDADVVEAFRARMQRRDLSLETPVSEDGQLRLVDRIESHGELASDAVADSQAIATLHDVLDQVRAGLNTRELDILENRILAHEPQTLEEIGNRYGVSKERIRQIEKRIRDKIVDAGRARFTPTRALLPA